MNLIVYLAGIIAIKKGCFSSVVTLQHNNVVMHLYWDIP